MLLAGTHSVGHQSPFSLTKMPPIGSGFYITTQYSYTYITEMNVSQDNLCPNIIFSYSVLSHPICSSYSILQKTDLGRILLAQRIPPGFTARIWFPLYLASSNPTSHLEELPPSWFWFLHRCFLLPGSLDSKYQSPGASPTQTATPGLGMQIPPTAAQVQRPRICCVGGSLRQWVT